MTTDNGHPGGLSSQATESDVSALRASIPDAGKTYVSEGVQMYCDYAPDERGDPTIEQWFFANCEDDPNDGYGYLEIFVKEIVQTQVCGMLAVYYRQWFNPEGEKLWGRKRVVGNLASLKAIISRRKMMAIAKAIEARSGETERLDPQDESAVACDLPKDTGHA